MAIMTGYPNKIYNSLFDKNITAKQNKDDDDFGSKGNDGNKCGGIMIFNLYNYINYILVIKKY